LIAPIALGTGRRLFGEGNTARLRLVDSSSTGTGLIIARYETAEARPC
jgi:hypothetical protein